MAAPGLPDRAGAQSKLSLQFDHADDADLAKLIAGAAARYTHTLPAELEPLPQSEVGPDEGGVFEPSLVSAIEVEAREEKLSAEIEYLKNQLEDRERAAREAQNVAAQLNQQLSSTKAQVETSKQQVHGGHKARIDRAESAVAQLKTQLHLAQNDIERERRAHRTDTISATTRVAQMEHEMAALTASAPVPKRRGKGISRARWVAISATVAISAASAILYLILIHAVPGVASARAGSAGGSSPGRQSEASQQIQLRTLALRASAGSEGQPENGLKVENGPKTDFTQSLDRLNTALTAFPGLAPSEVLRQVSALPGNNSVCAFQWNNGNPALVFKGGNHGSLAQSLERCAQAVEKLR